MAGTYFINAFLLVKGAGQEEAGHGVVLLGEEDEILPDAHGASARKQNWVILPGIHKLI